jgi:hypothetical protein
MRVLLDAQLSPHRIGAALAERGHDVRSIASDAALGALPDPDVLELAATERRVLITRNSRDFAPLLRLWAEAGRHHSGCILVWALQHHQFGLIVEGVTALLEARPTPDDWTDLSVAL